MPQQWVRVKDPVTGHEFSVSPEQADMAGVQPIDKQAATAFGEQAATKYKTSVDEQAAKKADAASKGA